MYKKMNRLIWIVTLPVFLFMTSGCANYENRTIFEEENRQGTRIEKEKGQKITGYFTSDGTYVEYKGYVRLAGADSLTFLSEKLVSSGINFGDDQYDMVVDQTLARSDVSELRINTTSGKSQFFMGMGIVCGIILIAIGIAAATKESCPFIYSYNGESFVFDGEPYGGATMSSLQRTDYSELEHLRTVDGQYRLMLTNEVDETQHTDSLDLLVVDHPRQARAVLDLAGQPHCFQNLSKLSGARDETGKDLLIWLEETDDRGWNPDLDHFSVQDSLLDTRNHITLEFPRPEVSEDLYLVSNVGTGQWGSHMIRVMLGMRGNTIDEFYTKINTIPEYQDQLRQWNEREELFLLGVEVEVGDHWEERATLHGGGPFVSENRALPLDLTGVTGDTIRLRVHPPIGFWRFNSFHLAWGETAASVVKADLMSAVNEKGLDVSSLLEAEDQVYLDFPTTQEYAEIVFAAPTLDPEKDRTVFAVTSGWYGIHLYNDGPPEAESLMRLTYEPGYVVRRAMIEYRQYRETGVLGYVNQDLMAQ